VLHPSSLVDAPLRRLVLTTPAFFDIFTRRTIGAVSAAAALADVVDGIDDLDAGVAEGC
jgi:hypothetical protein